MVLVIRDPRLAEKVRHLDFEYIEVRGDEVIVKTPPEDAVKKLLHELTRLEEALELCTIELEEREYEEPYEEEE